MARQRSPNREKAKKMYLASQGEIKLKDIAEELGVLDTQIRKWKNQDKWEQELKGTLPKTKRNVTNKKGNKTNSKKEPIADEVKEVLENTKLTDKQRLFCVHYIKCFNATKAYQKAYGCSYATANVEGFNTLVKPSVKAEIEKLKKNKLNRAMLSEDDIFQKYIDIAFADISDYLTFGQKELPARNPITGEKIIDDDGKEVTYTVNYVDFKESSEVDGTIISEVSKGKDGIKVKLQDKMRALQWLTEHMDLLSTETKLKLENEKAKLDIAKERLTLDNQKIGGGEGTGGNIDQLTQALKQSIDTFKKSGDK